MAIYTQGVRLMGKWDRMKLVWIGNRLIFALCTNRKLMQNWAANFYRHTLLMTATPTPYPYTVPEGSPTLNNSFSAAWTAVVGRNNHQKPSVSSSTRKSPRPKPQ